MKVALFIHSMRSGGAERVTASISNYWARQGWSVVLITNTDTESDFYDLEPAVKRLSLHMADDSTNALVALTRNWKRIQELRKLLRLESPDAAVGMMTTANCVLALAGRGLGIRLVGSERIHPPMYPLGRAWQLIRRYTYPLLNVIVAQTQRTADWISANIPGITVTVIPNPVELPLPDQQPRRDPRDLVGLVGSSKLILAVGRLEEQKGFDLLLESFTEIVSRQHAWHLVIVGEGSARADLEAKIAAHGVSRSVHLPGSVGNIGDWYKAADIFVLSSRYEGFPNCLVEAMAHDLPVFAFDCDTGPRDLIEDMENGVLVANGDCKALSKAILLLMSDDERRVALARRAGDIRDRLGIEKIANRWAEVLMPNGVADAE